MASLSLQPQQFGSWLHEPFLARASEPGSELGRHALGAFLTLRLADRFRPDEEPTHPLALAYQVRATRDYLLDLHPQNPEACHLLEVVRLADGVQQGGVRSMLEPPLLAYAHWLEQELKLEEALDVVETALGLNDGKAPTEEIAGLLQRGRILRLLGRFDEARVSYEAGRAKAADVGDTHSALLGRIGNAIVLRHLGNLSGSEKALREILKDAEAARDRDAQARAHHDIGATLLHRDKSRGAIPHLYRAFELYDQESNKLRALSDVAEALKREGQFEAAEDAFNLVVRTDASPQIRLSTMIALLELSALTGNRVAFARWRKEIAAMGPDLPPQQQVNFNIQLGLGHAAFGHTREAGRCLRRAITQAQQHRLNEHVFRAEAALRTLVKHPAQGGANLPTPPRAGDAMEVAEVAARLHALRAG